jgi:hypothetical protein
MYVEGVGQKSGPWTATFNDLLCFRVYVNTVDIYIQMSRLGREWSIQLNEKQKNIEKAKYFGVLSNMLL